MLWNNRLLRWPLVDCESLSLCYYSSILTLHSGYIWFYVSINFWFSFGHLKPSLLVFCGGQISQIKSLSHRRSTHTLFYTVPAVTWASIKPILYISIGFLWMSLNKRRHQQQDHISRTKDWRQFHEQLPHGWFHSRRRQVGNEWCARYRDLGFHNNNCTMCRHYSGNTVVQTQKNALGQRLRQRGEFDARKLRRI